MSRAAELRERVVVVAEDQERVVIDDRVECIVSGRVVDQTLATVVGELPVGIGEHEHVRPLRGTPDGAAGLDHEVRSEPAEPLRLSKDELHRAVDSFAVRENVVGPRAAVEVAENLALELREELVLRPGKLLDVDRDRAGELLPARRRTGY